MDSRPGFFRTKVCNSPELFPEHVCVLGGGGEIPGPLGLHPHSLHPANSTWAAKPSPQRCRNTLGKESRGASGILPFGHESVFTPAPSRPSLGCFPRKGAHVARSPTRRDPLLGLAPGVPGFEAPAVRC